LLSSVSPCGALPSLHSFPTRRSSDLVLPPCFLPFARGPWVRSAPGFPCALCERRAERCTKLGPIMSRDRECLRCLKCEWLWPVRDRKSTRLNSSHVKISYAVFCLKKK